MFGSLLTGSNFDDEVARLTGGRHGYGAKLTNIFSSEFMVETADSSTGLKFKQVLNILLIDPCFSWESQCGTLIRGSHLLLVSPMSLSLFGFEKYTALESLSSLSSSQVWRNNMQEKDKAEITKLKAGEKDFTRVTFVPDLTRTYTSDMLKKEWRSFKEKPEQASRETMLLLGRDRELRCKVFGIGGSAACCTLVSQSFSEAFSLLVYSHRCTSHSFLPGFEIESSHDNTVELMKRRVLDIAGCVQGVTVCLNGEAVKPKNFLEYVNLYREAMVEKERREKAKGEKSRDTPPPPVHYARLNDRWEVALMPSPNGLQQVRNWRSSRPQFVTIVHCSRSLCCFSGNTALIRSKSHIHFTL